MALDTTGWKFVHVENVSARAPEGEHDAGDDEQHMPVSSSWPFALQYSREILLLGSLGYPHPAIAFRDVHDKQVHTAERDLVMNALRTNP